MSGNTMMLQEVRKKLICPDGAQVSSSSEIITFGTLLRKLLNENFSQIETIFYFKQLIMKFADCNALINLMHAF